MLLRTGIIIGLVSFIVGTGTCGIILYFGTGGVSALRKLNDERGRLISEARQSLGYGIERSDSLQRGIDDSVKRLEVVTDRGERIKILLTTIKSIIGEIRGIRESIRHADETLQ